MQYSSTIDFEMSTKLSVQLPCHTRCERLTNKISPPRPPPSRLFFSNYNPASLPSVTERADGTLPTAPAKPYLAGLHQRADSHAQPATSTVPSNVIIDAIQPRPTNRRPGFHLSEFPMTVDTPGGNHRRSIFGDDAFAQHEAHMQLETSQIPNKDRSSIRSSIFFPADRSTPDPFLAQKGDGKLVWDGGGSLCFLKAFFIDIVAAIALTSAAVAAIIGIPLFFFGIFLIFAQKKRV